MKLIRAAANNDLKKVANCLRSGANINFQETMYGNTALHIALKNDYYALSKYLIKQGAKIDIKNEYGHSAIDVSIGMYFVGIEDNFLNGSSKRKKPKNFLERYFLTLVNNTISLI
jgi:ankyrin repeat protein